MHRTVVCELQYVVELAHKVYFGS